MERTRDGVSSVSSGHHGAIVHFVLQHKMHLLVVDSVVSGTSDWLDTHYWATVAWMHVDNHVEESCCCKESNVRSPFVCSFHAVDKLGVRFAGTVVPKKSASQVLKIHVVLHERDNVGTDLLARHSNNEANSVELAITFSADISDCKPILVGPSKDRHCNPKVRDLVLGNVRSLICSHVVCSRWWHPVDR